MKIEIWPIDRPKPYAKNPRIITDAAIEKVASSIRAFGFRQPLVVDHKGTIIVGHKRFLAAKRLRLTEIPVTIADNLSLAEIKSYRIADNRVADETDWDASLLADELSSLQDLDFPLDITGFDLTELDELLGEAEEEDRTDEVTEVIAKPGDTWLLGPHRLHVNEADLQSRRALDLTIKRWHRYSGHEAILEATGESWRKTRKERILATTETGPVAPRSKRDRNHPPRAA